MMHTTGFYCVCWKAVKQSKKEFIMILPVTRKLQVQKQYHFHNEILPWNIKEKYITLL